MSKNKAIRKNKLFDIEKSSTTFISLMSKYNNRNTKIKNKDKCYIAKEIDKKRFELEKEEKEDLFIFKEAKNISHINQELIYNYGTKAKIKEYNVSKFQSPIKLGKKLFFDPTKYSTLPNSLTPKIIKKGILNFPLISTNKYKNNNKPLLTYSNTNILKNKNKNKKNSTINTDSSFSKYKQLNFSPIKSNLDSSIETDTNLCPSSFRNKANDINSIIKELIKNKKSKNNKKMKKLNNIIYYNNRNLFSYNGSYLTSVTNFKDQLINEEKKQRNYFNRNDYGCKLFKEKYDFLSKKYFSPD